MSYIKNPIPLEVINSDGFESIIVDSDGNQIKMAGNPADMLKVEDQQSLMMLNDILKEMKKMNLHLAMITDNFLTNEDVEV